MRADPNWRFVIVPVCLAVLLAQLMFANARTSMTWDEGHHLFDGYTALRYGDFDLNPEVPPVAKLAAALPLLPMQLKVPQQQGRDSQLEAFLDGKAFLFGNDADALLTRGRLMIACFTLLLAWMVYWAASEYFGWESGVVALLFLVFDPNLLAHGALVTTDAAITCLFFATLVCWNRYADAPSWSRLLLAGIVLGCTFATKFTGLLLVPILFVLALVETLRGRSWSLLLRRVLALAAMTVMAWVVLWAFYRFRYSIRPDGLAMNPALPEYLQRYASVGNPRPLVFLARWKLLPEAYIWGLINTKLTEQRDLSYLFGTLRRHGTWMYFPAAMAIKSTLPFLVLLGLSAWTLFQRDARRYAMVRLLIPAGLFLAVAMHSSMNIGVRHILPIYPLLYCCGAYALVFVAHQRRAWVWAGAALLAFQIGTSVAAAPAYIAYANELWGGPRHVHRYLSDSNSDWGQQLKDAGAYLREHHITDCWIAYTAEGTVDRNYYGVPCKPLPTAASLWWFQEPMHVPDEIRGTVLVSDDMLSGVDDEGAVHPYSAFRQIKPVAVLQGGLFVYQGTFAVPQAAAQVRAANAAFRR